MNINICQLDFLKLRLSEKNTTLWTRLWMTRVDLKPYQCWVTIFAPIAWWSLSPGGLMAPTTRKQIHLDTNVQTRFSFTFTVQWKWISLNVLQMNKQFMSEIILRTICDQRFLLSVAGCLMGAVTFGTNDRGWLSGNRPGEHISLTAHLPSLTEPNLHILHCPQTIYQRVLISLRIFCFRTRGHPALRLEKVCKKYRDSTLIFGPGFVNVNGIEINQRLFMENSKRRLQASERY